MRTRAEIQVFDKGDPFSKLKDGEHTITITVEDGCIVGTSVDMIMVSSTMKTITTHNKSDK